MDREPVIPEVHQLHAGLDDGLEIFFVKEMNNVQKVYRAKRAAVDAQFEQAEVDVPLSNNSVNTRVSWLSPDACTMFLTRSATSDTSGPFTFVIATRN